MSQFRADIIKSPETGEVAIFDPEISSAAWVRATDPADVVEVER